MASFIDQLMHKRGELTMVGLHWARSGLYEWTRLPEETEREFIRRAQNAAKAEGLKIVTYGGAVHVTDQFDLVTNGGINGRPYVEESER